MGDLSKSVIFDAAKNKPRQWVIKVGLERRTEKAPNGKVERWVDLQGNVVFLQVLQPAALRNAPEHVDAARARFTRRGYIQHARCPLTTGSFAPEDFPTEELQQHCRTGSFGAGNPCKHVLHVMATRQAEQAEKCKIMEDQFFSEKRQKEAIEREKIAATDRLHDRIGQVLERVVEAPPPKRGKDGG